MWPQRGLLTPCVAWKPCKFLAQKRLGLSVWVLSAYCQPLCSSRHGNKSLFCDYPAITRSARKTVQPFFSKGHFVCKNTCEVLLLCTKGEFPVAVFCVSFMGLQRSLQFLFIVPYKVKPASMFEHKILKFVCDSCIECSNTCPPWMEFI